MTVFSDMSKILMAEKPSVLLSEMADNGTLGKIFPEIQAIIDFRTQKQSKNLWKHTLQVIDQTLPKLELRWAALFHDVGKPAVVREIKKVTFHGHETVGAKIWELVCKRIGTGYPFYVKVGIIIRSSGDFAAITDNSHVSVTDSAVRRFVKGVCEENIENIYQFAMADMTTADKAKEKRMKAALTNLKVRIDEMLEKDHNPDPRLPKGTGTKIMEATGLKGRALGNMMDYLTKGLVEGKLSVDDDFGEIAKDLCEEMCRETIIWPMER